MADAKSNGNGKPPAELSPDMVQYLAAAHAMQTGVAGIMELDRTSRGLAPLAVPEISPNCETSPKHLRVGVNSAMVDHAALVRCLTDAGVFKRSDYEAALNVEMAREVVRYETRLTELVGKTVRLA